MSALRTSYCRLPQGLILPCVFGALLGHAIEQGVISLNDGFRFAVLVVDDLAVCNLPEVELPHKPCASQRNNPRASDRG